jgi:hypothetical protein
MQLAAGEAGFERQQARHGVAGAIGIGEAVAQHHVAAALAIDRAAESSHAVEEAAVGSKPPGMEFGVTARQEQCIGNGVRGLVVQRREGHDLRASHFPSRQQVGIGKAEGLVAGNGNALPKGR